MSHPRPLIAILAIADDDTIGIDGRLPWRTPEDLARFKRLTMGHAVIMGRRTYDSIGKPLPGRCNVVITRRSIEVPEFGPLVWTSYAGEQPILFNASSPDRALRYAAEIDKTPYLIGGGEIYHQLWDYVGKVELTLVHRRFESPAGTKTVFVFDREPFVETARVRSEQHEDVEFVTLERRT